MFLPHHIIATRMSFNPQETSSRGKPTAPRTTLTKVGGIASYSILVCMSILLDYSHSRLTLTPEAVTSPN